MNQKFKSIVLALLLGALISACTEDLSQPLIRLESNKLVVDLAEQVRAAADAFLPRIRQQRASSRKLVTVSQSCTGTGSAWASPELQSTGASLVLTVTTNIGDPISLDVMTCIGAVELLLEEIPYNESVAISVEVTLDGISIGTGFGEFNLTDALAGTPQIPVTFTTFTPEEYDACQADDNCTITGSFLVQVVAGAPAGLDAGEGFLVRCTTAFCKCDLGPDSPISVMSRPFVKKFKAQNLFRARIHWQTKLQSHCIAKCDEVLGIESFNVVGFVGANCEEVD